MSLSSWWVAFMILCCLIAIALHIERMENDVAFMKAVFVEIKARGSHD